MARLHRKFDILQEIRGCFEIGYCSLDVVILRYWMVLYGYKKVVIFPARMIVI